MKYVLDDKDRLIIRALQRDGRMTNQALAQEVNLSPSPCLRRFRLLEGAGVISGFSARVDAKKFGLSMLAFLTVRLSSHNKEVVRQFESRIKLMDEVVGCYLLTGGQDYLLQVRAADLDGFEAFVREKLHELGTVTSIDSSICYSVVKDTAVFPQV